MKNHLKDQIFNNFLLILEESMPELSEAKRRRLAETMCDNSYQVYQKNTEVLNEINNNAIYELEKHRGQFKEYIDFTQSKTNKILANFKENGFVTKKYDENTKKTILKGRTTMVDDMVYFLNELNNLVILFYKDVYKVEDTSIEHQQITLF